MSNFMYDTHQVAWNGYNIAQLYLYTCIEALSKARKHMIVPHPRGKKQD